ncbi:AAA domain-containing protein [Candidatus Margulisiibacteriota bacterium]
MQENQTEKDINNPQLGFVKDVAKYFMNFLETDFKKRRLPKRNTIQKTQKGLRVGIDLEKYPKLKKTLLKHFNNGFNKEDLLIRKGAYTGAIPKTLLNLIYDKIKKLSTNDLHAAFKKIQKMAEEKIVLFSKEYDKYLEESIEETKNIIANSVVLPFLDDLDKPLENLEIADENSKYQLEIDIVDSLFAAFEENLAETFQSFFQKPRGNNLSELLEEIISLSEIRESLISFFEKYSISDAFYDIYQIFRNNKLVDKSEIYAYFHEISLGNEKFPVFYMPIAIQKEENKFLLQFEKRLYVNIKAIDFVVQEFNLQTQKKSTLVGEFERIIYINEENEFFSLMETIIRRIENFFEFNRNIDLHTEKLQKGVNLIASLSNKVYFYLFDKSDEALINDYEEILNDKGEILEIFSSLLNGFIEKNPVAFMEEIANKWDEKSIPKKLIFESPIPLNDEQKQVLLALQKPECKFMILEGPPGTGKSHTITAVICKALLEEKSVLVLSDKKEALDVVENKIADTLNKIRREDDFQNPILRLGRSGNKFYKIVQGQAIQKIKEHYRSYQNKREQYNSTRSNKLKTLENNLSESIDHFDKIDLQDVLFYIAHLETLSTINWADNKGQLSVAKESFLKIKSSIIKLHSHKNCSYRAEFANTGNLNLLSKLESLYNSIETAKSKINNLSSRKKEIQELMSFSPAERTDMSQGLVKIQQVFSEISSASSKVNLSYLEKLTDQTTLSDLLEKKRLITHTLDLFGVAKKFFENNLQHSQLLEHFVIPSEFKTNDANMVLNEYLINLKKLRTPILGYLFKKEKVIELTRQLKKTFHFFNIERPERSQQILWAIHDLFEMLNAKLVNDSNANIIFCNIIQLLTMPKKDEQLNTLAKISQNFILISDEIKKLYYYASLKICDIDEQEAFIKTIELSIEIQEINSNLKGIQLNKTISSKHLIFESLENDINIISKMIISLKELLTDSDDIYFLQNFQKLNKEIAGNISLNMDSDKISQLQCVLLGYSDEEIKTYLKFKEIEQKLEEQFTDIPNDNFQSLITEIEDLVTAEMTFFLDKRIIEYTSDYAGEVHTIKSIVRKKQRFPKALFQNLKKAFPCILAGIRDYAEYIPLEKDLFDLIIIDEASQVSIAQALPALIRGKQIIVLGDDKQFSSVKANNASTVTNQQHKSKIQSSFLEERCQGEDQFGWLTKVKDNFDIKNSILKFLRFIRNYECQLKKHFRCYPEVISYSDKHFYGNSLQCMKIRGKPISDVIVFEVIDHDGKLDKTKNTNELEVDAIVKKLREMKSQGTTQSLGIITPHREQVTLLFDRINSLQEKDWLFDKCKLKIMTFDTCQGEERDYIFYSMVATREKDRLKWIFPKDFSTISDEIEGTIKAQRLNVGFSRSKETIHFVLSKPIEEFQGEIKNAMLHYKNTLEDSRNNLDGETDKSSPMEQKVLHFITETEFYKQYKQNIELIPQFPLGNYLRQLDRTYSHPAYKVDFLMIFEDTKIIIEYDGFKEHFINRGEVNESNYQAYMKDEDIYRQKVLEGYGYSFLRINRFNIGKDPIETLNQRLTEICKKKVLSSSALEEYHEQISRLQDGDEKSCDSCGKIFEAQYFPYKSSGLCLWCYEKKHNKTLRTLRKKLRLMVRKKPKDSPRKNRKKSWDNNNTESIDEIMQRITKTESKTSIINKAYDNHHSIAMTYKGIKRTIHPYACNNIYCIAYCNYRKGLRTFRIDRMRNVKIGPEFLVDHALQNEAQSKIKNIRRISY